MGEEKETYFVETIKMFFVDEEKKEVYKEFIQPVKIQMLYSPQCRYDPKTHTLFIAIHAIEDLCQSCKKNGNCFLQNYDDLDVTAGCVGYEKEES